MHFPFFSLFVVKIFLIIKKIEEFPSGLCAPPKRCRIELLRLEVLFTAKKTFSARHLFFWFRKSLFKILYHIIHPLLTVMQYIPYVLSSGNYRMVSDIYTCNHSNPRSLSSLQGFLDCRKCRRFP